MNTTTTAVLALALIAGQAHASCNVDSVRQPLPVRDGTLAPLAPGLHGGPDVLAFAGEALALPQGELLALDQVLLRRRLSDCVVDEYAGYVPRTEFDNTPYRFNMDQGKNFSAEEFDAWMKKRGIRIAKGRAGATQAPTTQAQPAGAQLPDAQAPVPPAEESR
ncbi:MAG TPA: hypothetical protein VFG21_09220 [Xanthomonadaceae bacterium]|nr:hypothetical protein [Xanthomonadaceae bacterium]